MKLAVSNIAWLSEEEEDILPLLREMGVEGIEIAPTKYWPNPDRVSKTEIEAVKTRLNSSGFRIPSAQAILFGHPELTLFHNEETRNRTLDYLLKISSLSSTLGVSTLVFGSPKIGNVMGYPWI